MIMKPFAIPPQLREVAAVFIRNRYQVFLVGGAVRDFCQGKTPIDFDIATDASPQQVTALFKRVLATGIEHGTVTICFKGKSFECTTFRTEGKYSDARHPDAVQFVSSIEEDISRRDFTINAMAISLETNELLDLYDGVGDLRAGIIRTVGNAEERFTEDPLRMLRAVRFASRFHFRLEENTKRAIQSLAKKISTVSSERIHDELSKILQTKKPIVGLKLLDETGLLDVILPELAVGRGLEQGEFHNADVLTHSFVVCDNTPNVLELRLAGLLHDIGKPQTRTVDDCGRIHFYRHEIVGEKIATSVLRRLKFSNKTIDKVTTLIRYHMFNYTSEWKDSTIRRFIINVGEDTIDELLQLRLADIGGLKKECADISHVAEFKTRIEKIMQEKQCLNLKALQITGSDLMKLGVPKGKVVGQILNELLQTVLDDPSENNRDTLLKIAKNLKEKYLIQSESK